MRFLSNFCRRPAPLPIARIPISSRTPVGRPRPLTSNHSSMSACPWANRLCAPADNECRTYSHVGPSASTLSRIIRAYLNGFLSGGVRMDRELAPLARSVAAPAAPLRLCTRLPVGIVEQYRIPLSGESHSIWCRLRLGRAAGSLWEPMLAGTVASFLGGACAFWLGRRLGHGRLTKIHWLHLTTKRLEWPERYFKRHSEKTVFLARFIPVLPSAVANLLEGTTTIPWRTYLWLNLAGSAILLESSGKLRDCNQEADKRLIKKSLSRWHPDSPQR
jgi:hypothetical protein